MKKFSFLVLLIILSFNLSAQDKESTNIEKSQNQKAIDNYKELASELKGKYQIQVINTRQQQIISHELLNEIKNKMTENEDVTIRVSPTLQILVLSKASQKTKRISEENFTIYIEE